MNVQSRRLAGILLVVLPTVVIGGVSLLSLLIWEPAYAANPLRQDLWRAGHAHAGVLLVLSLIVLRYVDEARFSEAARWFVRLSVPAAAILLPAAFFLSVLSPTAQQPNGIIYLAFVGAALLAAGVLTLGVGLIRGGKPTRTEVNSMTDTFLPYIEKPERLIMKLVYFFYAPTIRQGAYTAEGSCRAIADRLRNVLRKSEPTGQKTHAATGVGDAHPASGGTHQHLPFLHRYRPIIHDQGVNEPG